MSGKISQSTSSFFQRRPGRRGFLRGAAIGAAGTAAVAVGGIAPLVTSGGSASAAPGTPPFEVTNWGARNGPSLLTERVAGPTSQHADNWRVTGQLRVKNNGGSTKRIHQMQVSYLGANPPLTLVTFLGEEPIDIGAGKSAWVDIPDRRLHSYPMPAVLQTRMWAEGHDDPFLSQAFLSEYTNEITGGAYYFPGKTSDLPNGQYWATGGNHGYGSAHGGTTLQRFAYDLHVRRWTGSFWSTIKAGGDAGEKEDHLIWGTPVYAPATGYIIHAAREKPDYEPGDPAGTAGGNHFWIQTEAGDAETGGFWLLAHLMQYSPPEELVPVEDGPGPLVYRGQFLGLAGNSGNSSGPHLHIHYQRGMHKFLPGASSSYGEGRPIKFRDLRVRRFFHHDDQWDPNAGSQHWNTVNPYAGIGENTLLDTDGPPLVVPSRSPYPAPGDELGTERPNETFEGGSATIDGGFATLK